MKTYSATCYEGLLICQLRLTPLLAPDSHILPQWPRHLVTHGVSGVQRLEVGAGLIIGGVDEQRETPTIQAVVCTSLSECEGREKNGLEGAGLWVGDLSAALTLQFGKSADQES
jgi:hypothetical protein